jgi:hypothetical protein
MSATFLIFTKNIFITNKLLNLTKFPITFQRKKSERKKSAMRPKQYLALRNVMVEFFGTAAIVYFSNFANLLYELDIIKVGAYGIVYGLIISLMIYIGLDTSGGHYDPAVTVTPSHLTLPSDQLLGLQKNHLHRRHPLPGSPVPRRRLRRLPHR